MRKALEAIPTSALVTALLLLLMASPILIKIALPFAQRYLVLGALLLLPLLVAPIPFLIAIFAWRIRQRIQDKRAIEV